MPQDLIVTPPGSLLWASVLKPKLKNAGKPDEKQVYECDLLLPMADKDAQHLIQTIKGEFTARFGERSRPGSKGMPARRYVDDDGNETDIWKISFSRNVVTARGTPLPPPIVQDAKGQPWPLGLLIGNGSEGKIAFKPWTWSNHEGGMGISLELHGVRVLNHVAYAPPDAAAAFGDAEDGCDVSTLQDQSWPAEATAGQTPGPSTEEEPW